MPLTTCFSCGLAFSHVASSCSHCARRTKGGVLRAPESVHDALEHRRMARVIRDLQTRRGRFCWICNQCHVVRDDTMDNEDASYMENLMGRRLAWLTQEGRKLLNPGGNTP